MGQLPRPGGCAASGVLDSHPRPVSTCRGSNRLLFNDQTFSSQSMEHDRWGLWTYWAWHLRHPRYLIWGMVLGSRYLYSKLLRIWHIRCCILQLTLFITTRKFLCQSPDLCLQYTVKVITTKSLALPPSLLYQPIGQFLLDISFPGQRNITVGMMH